MQKKIKNKRFWALGGVFISAVVIFLFDTHPVSAALWDSLWSNAGGEDTVKFLTKYQDYLGYGNFLTSILHVVGWLIIKGLFSLTSFVEGLIPQSLNLLDFLDYAGVQGITKAIINDLVVALMVLTLVYLGFKTVIAKEPPNFKSVGVNIFMSAFLILGLPTLMSTMQDMSLKFYNDTQTDGNNGQVKSLSWNLIQENITDLLYVSSRGFSILDDPGSKKNGLTPDSFKTANLNDLITPDTVNNASGDEIKNLAYKLDTDENGKNVADKIKGGAFSLFSNSFDEGYFRYQWKFILIVVGLIAMGLAYLFTLFVFVTTVIEIGFKQVVGLFVFATDLESGQRTKMVVQDIMNAFMLIAFTGLSLKMYTLFLSFLGSKHPNVFIYVIALISATFVLIKGSNTIMRYFGVDVGVKEGFGQLVGAFALGRATANGIKKVGDLAKNSAKKVNPEESRDQLAQKAENGISSINDSGSKGTGNTLNGINGKSIRNAVKEKLGRGIRSNNINSVNSPMNNLSMAAGENMNGAVDAATGVITGAKATKKAFSSVNDVQNVPSTGIYSNNDHEMQGASSSKSMKENTATGQAASKQANASQIKNGTTRTKEEILAEMRLKEAVIPNKNMEAMANVKLNPNADKSINQESTAGSINSPLKQDVVQGIRENELNNNPLRQDVIQDAKPGLHSNNTVKQSIGQDIQLGKMNVNPIRQDVIQDVKNVAGNTSTITQNVVQNSNPITPNVQDQIQHIQHVMSAAKLPLDTQNSVQKVIQEVQQGGNVQTPETLKTKVIQELENASFGAKEPIKQVIMQDIQKAFSATPEQQHQTIKQTFETVSHQKSTTLEQQKVETKAVNEIENRQANDSKSKYFGSLFGEKVEDYSNKNKPKKSSRFDFIKNV